MMSSARGVEAEDGDRRADHDARGVPGATRGRAGPRVLGRRGEAEGVAAEPARHVAVQLRQTTRQLRWTVGTGAGVHRDAVQGRPRLAGAGPVVLPTRAHPAVAE